MAGNLVKPLLSLYGTENGMEGACVATVSEAQAAVASKSSLQGLSSGLLEGFSKLVSNFTGASQTFEFDFCMK